MFCTRCGQQNSEDSRFCSNCGAPLSRPGGPVASERSTETTSTISLSAIESRLDADAPEEGKDVTSGAARRLPPGMALLVVAGAERGEPVPAGP